MDNSQNPATPSLAHAALAPYWRMIRSILGGAAEVKAAGETYLPKLPAEDDDEYNRRKQSAPWRPEYADCVRGIVGRPFAKEVTLAGEPSGDAKALAEDIDGRGNNLHTFARATFEAGVDMGAAGILIDFPTMNPNATLAEEKAAGARPYWVLVKADEIVSLRTRRRGAREIVTHLRLRETVTMANGFEETAVEKIRVIEPGLWQIWHQVKDEKTGQLKWEIEAQGILTLEEVPFVFYTTNERVGAQYVLPPLLDLAVMQIELYQQGSNKEQIYTAAGSPMLTANGMAAPEDGSSVEVGPKRVLYAPGAEGIQTGWAYIQPDAANMKEIREDVAATVQDMRRLGLQPLLPQTGNVTATASGIEAAKSHTAVGTWANGLKDALEQAWVFTSQWRKSTEEVEVQVHTDFGVGLHGVEEIKELREARKSGDLSQRTYWDELTRRGVLGPAFDPDAEEEALLDEGPPELTEDDVKDALLLNPPQPPAPPGPQPPPREPEDA